MQKLTYLFFIAGLLLFTGCKDYVDEYVTYTINEPVFMPVSEFRSAVAVEQPQPIVKQGKILFFNGYLYISQPEKGIHVIDNQNPSSPRNVAFIDLLGNADMQVRNNILYADSYIDLVWFDISDPAKPVYKGRKEEVFPQAFPPTENGFSIDYEKSMDRNNGIVVGWKKVEKRDIYHDNLYTVMNNQLGIFDLLGEAPAKVGQDMYIGFNVETIFSYKNCMFMGTPTGMIIYSMEDPLKPERQSMISHVFGCDPVVVENDIAYVTVRSGTFCGQPQRARH